MTRPTPRHPSAGSAPGLPLPPDIEQYLSWLAIEKNRPATTVRSYRSQLAKFAVFAREFVPEGAPVAPAVDRDLLHAYQVRLAALLPHPRSRAHALVALRRFLAYAYDEGWTSKEFSRQVTIPRYVVGDPHPVPSDLVPELLDLLPCTSLKEARDRALVYFLLSSGCRIAEACSLNKHDVKEGGFRVLGKGGKYRTVYCTRDAMEAIDAYLLMRGPDASPALFINVSPQGRSRHAVHQDNRLTTDGARRALTAMKSALATTPRAARILDLLKSPHAARHTAATTLLEATNGDVRLVQEVLGHATLETLKVYTEITDARKRDAYRKLESYLDELGPAARARRRR